VHYPVVISAVLLLGVAFFFFDLDAERFQELQILVADFEFWIRGKRGNQGSLVRGLFALLAHSDGGFKNEEDVISAVFDPGNNLGNLLGVRQGFVDRIAEFFHQLLQLWIHGPPSKSISYNRLDAARGKTVHARERWLIVAPQAAKIEGVAKVSTARKLGVVAHVAGRQVGRNRMVRAAWGAVRGTTRSFVNVLHQLWLEVMGVIFLVMAMTFASGAVREYAKYRAREVGPGRFGVAILFAATFAWFGLSSFWRVRKRAK
jgi:hypothetical protein